MMRARATTEAMISGQIGQPMAKTMANNSVFLQLEAGTLRCRGVAPQVSTDAVDKYVQNLVSMAITACCD
ncbi:hypothetical protein SDC9_205458 [bioreactor metagenome]|uniref:Uncharacterized protein n=1 Tax=bioreactor metagenome TaxID=1076179 RepID=A0A645JBK3_9ZZZZ